ncbi:DUF4902 domain-containing protein [Pseudomonas asuensis]|uniref:DUF4902 domain-containing protein n=1 Tax=Pseudomonas asuensis TaxID=1825787 RepID=A0ABQ2H316_9PSED|nr:DUF4902 domain-containing protein [Pseudomonas asuensis]GGM26301.1 hypothetical protein GCM10009425_41210 [Pseudomonas asuensis]
MLAHAPDHFIRQSLKEFSQLTFQQYMVWMDAELQEEMQMLGLDSKTAGFCEWASTSGLPQVSLGWAWYRSQADNLIYLAPGGIQTNLMLCCKKGYDLGVRCTEEMLISWLASQDWQSDISL